VFINFVFTFKPPSPSNAASTETKTSTEARDCQDLIRQLKGKHKQIALQWIPGHCQITGNKQADLLAKKGAKITQTYIRETSYHSIKLHLKQVFRSAHRHELETRLSHKPWTQEISKVTDWPRKRAVAEFRLCVGHYCLGTHLHRIAIRPDPYCTLCNLHEPMDRNHLGHCTALSNKTEYEPGQDKDDGKLTFLFYYFCDYSLALGLYIYLVSFSFPFLSVFFYVLLLSVVYVNDKHSLYLPIVK